MHDERIVGEHERRRQCRGRIDRCASARVIFSRGTRACARRREGWRVRRRVRRVGAAHVRRLRALPGVPLPNRVQYRFVRVPRAAVCVPRRAVARICAALEGQAKEDPAVVREVRASALRGSRAGRGAARLASARDERRPEELLLEPHARHEAERQHELTSGVFPRGRAVGVRVRYVHAAHAARRGRRRAHTRARVPLRALAALAADKGDCVPVEPERAAHVVHLPVRAYFPARIPSAQMQCVSYHRP